MSAFDWIAQFPKAFSDLSYFIAGHSDKARMISEIIQKADQISVTMALGGDPNKLAEKPQMSFAKQLLIALRQVVGSYKLNSQQGGCDGWLTDDGLWVMSKSTADNVRATLMQQGIAVPSQNGKLFDELQTHKLIDITSDGKAVWSCKVTSNEGWTHDKPFSLLRIPAQVIWENIDQRPNTFAGRVETTNTAVTPVIPSMDTNTATITSDITQNITDQGIDIAVENILAQKMIEPETATMNEAETADIHSDEQDNLDFVLNLFPVPNNEQSHQQPEPAEAVEKSEPVKITQTVLPETDLAITESTANIEKPKHKKATKSKTEQAKRNSLVIAQSETNGEYEEIEPQKFITWIKAGIISGQLFVNRPNAVLHMVENHLFLVTPSIFKIYLRDVVKTTDANSWELLQKRFQMLGIHRRQHTEDDSRNIWKCSVVGPNKKSMVNITRKTKMTFEQLLEKFLKYRNLRPNTVRSYRNVVTQLLNHYPNLRPQDITDEHIIEWREVILSRAKPISWNNYACHLRALYNFGIENELLKFKRNPFKAFFVREGREKKKTYTDSELEIIDHLLSSDYHLNPYLS